MPKIQLEGNLSGLNTVICVCGYCANSDNENARIELNFLEQKIIYSCSQCKKENSIIFGKQPPPYPRTKVSK